MEEQTHWGYYETVLLTRQPSAQEVSIGRVQVLSRSTETPGRWYSYVDGWHWNIGVGPICMHYAPAMDWQLMFRAHRSTWTNMKKYKVELRLKLIATLLRAECALYNFFYTKCCGTPGLQSLWDKKILFSKVSYFRGRRNRACCIGSSVHSF